MSNPRIRHAPVLWVRYEDKSGKSDYTRPPFWGALSFFHWRRGVPMGDKRRPASRIGGRR